MKTILQDIFTLYQNEIKKIFLADEPLSLARVETEGLELSKKMIGELLVAYIGELTSRLADDKSGRREAGLVIERKGDERKVLTEIGEVTYTRDYYYDRHNKQYRYLVDEMLGICKGQRISSGLGISLAGAATDMSYEKSSRYVAGGRISRQSVMIKLRGSQPMEAVPGKRKRVPVLHIDADEDHVTLTGGKKGIVPLVSVYEGVGRNGKRNFCKEVFHISEYGLSPDDFWDGVLGSIEKKYELDATRIYLHGDGAPWIRTGMEWLPNCRFVLDKYHKNKGIKAMCAGLTVAGIRRDVENGIRESLNNGNEALFSDITESLCAENPEKEEKIRNNAAYLQNHIAGIKICNTDPESNNGGCSEPHVSHVLSSRLSDRPRVWSAVTLSSLAPILASRGKLIERPKPTPILSPLLNKAAAAGKKIFKPKNTIGLPDPDSIGTLTAISIGKINPTFRAVYSFTN